MTGLEQTRKFEDVAIGDDLPELNVPVSVTSIVASAIATRDFHPVHHDVDYARAAGSKSIFMNILTTNGYVERYVREWGGPGSRPLSIQIRLGEPNYPGDVMKLTGSVTARSEGDERWVDVAVRGANSRGAHVLGSVRIALE
ncbi:MaoC family dehydratase [Paraburkholderia sacchari]|uniref:MaoC family dehydratase n=1 Tax=Paraburkholderia sacchari TaxID=159450 RepID=A0A8T6ZI55_9BURK|nr:MaoC family dehydratase [Paraburkholderia sacchari]NLP64887.1 MaoC family dehydratase [Paraburkholderia sacchari]